MEMIGKIKKIMDVQQISDTFKKREFVLTVDYNSPYPQYVLFQTIQDKCSMLDKLKINDEVKVFFHIRGREWTNPQGEVKYFNQLDAWRIDVLSSVVSTQMNETPGSISSIEISKNINAEQTSLDNDDKSLDNDLPW